MTQNKLILRKGKSSKSTKKLLTHLKRIFEPHTTTKLKQTNTLSLKEYTPLIDSYDVSHIFILKETLSGINLTLTCCPSKTFYFKILEYSLIENNTPFKLYEKDPYVVITGTPKIEEFNFLNTFKNSEDIRRVLHLHFKGDTLFLRHYAVVTEHKQKITTRLQEIGPRLLLQVLAPNPRSA